MVPVYEEVDNCSQSSSLTDSPMVILVSWFEYCNTIIWVSSIPSLCLESARLSRSVNWQPSIPSSDSLSELGVTVASQQLDIVGGHVC